MKKILYIIFMSSFILSDRGDLISYEFVDSMDLVTIQNDLNNSFGSLAPEAQYDIKLYSSSDIRSNLQGILDEIQEKVKDKIIHISFDIDVIDPILGPSTGTTVDKGLNMYDIYTILNNITKNNLIASCDFVEYNPEIGSVKEKERTLNYMELSINTVINNL